MTDIIVIYPNNNFVIINKAQDLKEFQTLVEGSIQFIGLKEYGAMYINEEGKLKKMKPNPLASILSGYDIVGPAIICGPPDDEGDDTSYTEDQLKMVLELREKHKLYPNGPKSCQEVYDDINNTVPDDIKDKIVNDEEEKSEN